MLKLRDLNKKFGSLNVLQGIDLEIREGMTTAILGPNGSGKSTFIKCILGLVHPDRGEILFVDHSVKNQWRYRSQIGYLPQIASFPENLKVAELIHMVEDIRGKASNRKDLIDMFNLVQYHDKKLKYLSGGTRQKINLLLTFMFDCPLYILDEPTSGLDPVAMIRFKDYLRTLKGLGKTILITTHVMDLVEEIADELVFLLEGMVYFKGQLKDLVQQTGELNLEHAIAGILTKENAKNTQVQFL